LLSEYLSEFKIYYSKPFSINSNTNITMSGLIRVVQNNAVLYEAIPKEQDTTLHDVLDWEMHAQQYKPGCNGVGYCLQCPVLILEGEELLDENKQTDQIKQKYKRSDIRLACKTNLPEGDYVLEIRVLR
jgi:ferredoxin